MKEERKPLFPLWFRNTLKKVMEYLSYEDGWVYVEESDKHGKWSPVDLILREYFNNGCGSSRGFLGITSARCEKAAEYIRSNKDLIMACGLVSKDGWNNVGNPLWSNYGF